MSNFAEQKVIIYGAGMVGNLVRQYYEILGYEDNIVAFAVSDNVQEQTIYGYDLYCINDLIKYKDKCCVIIATFPEAQKDIEIRLRKLNFSNIIKINYEMYQKMCDCYISYFISQKKYKKAYDIIYMASDNNRTSGAFLCLIELVKDISRKGLNALVVLPEYGNGEQLLIDEDIDYTYVISKTWLSPCDNKKLNWNEMKQVDNDTAISELEIMIKEYGVKIIHCNTIYTYVGAVAAHNKNIAVIWHIREKVIEQGYTFRDEEQFYKLLNKSYNIITVSDYIKSCYPKLDENKVITLYDGLDLEKYYCERNIFTNDITKIIIPAALYSLKRQEDLVKAAYLLRSKNYQFNVELIGSGDEYIDYIKELINEYCLNDCVNLLGIKENIEWYYKNADIVVSCSGVEAFGRICVEGAAAGCLVIGADSGGTRELISDKKTGLLFHFGNYKSLAEALEYVLNNKEKAVKIAKMGQINSMKMFTKDTMSEQIFDIYKHILCQ